MSEYSGMSHIILLIVFCNWRGDNALSSFTCNRLACWAVKSSACFLDHWHSSKLLKHNTYIKSSRAISSFIIMLSSLMVQTNYFRTENQSQNEHLLQYSQHGELVPIWKLISLKLIAINLFAAYLSLSIIFILDDSSVSFISSCDVEGTWGSMLLSFCSMK